MKATVRISWLIAGTLVVSRLLAALANEIVYSFYHGYSHLALPRGDFSFVPWLNAIVLLSVSFAIVSTCGWLIERRFAKPR